MKYVGTITLLDAHDSFWGNPYVAIATISVIVQFLIDILH